MNLGQRLVPLEFDPQTSCPVSAFPLFRDSFASAFIELTFIEQVVQGLSPVTGAGVDGERVPSRDPKAAWEALLSEDGGLWDTDGALLSAPGR